MRITDIAWRDATVAGMREERYTQGVVGGHIHQVGYPHHGRREAYTPGTPLTMGEWA